MAIELRHLRFLVAVADAGSVSGAARRLYMTQPAVTTALRNLERDVGVTLLTRHARGVDLTPAGAAFLAQAHLALEHVDEATRSARQFAATLHRGTLSIGFLPATFSVAAATTARRVRPNPSLCVVVRSAPHLTLRVPTDRCGARTVHIPVLRP